MGMRTESPELGRVRISDGFWETYIERVRSIVIPYQWEALNDRIPDAEPSYAIRNFRIAAGEKEGGFGGLVFQDSDVAKWLEAVGYSLAIHPDPELEKTADELIDLLGRAQQPDGYLNTYFTVKEPGNRWKNLMECHELYCAGHLIEGAVAYYQGTGKKKFLDIMSRYADYIDTVFGPEEGKLKGYCGHEEIELALVKLYKATGNKKYLNLACYFIDERGKEPNYFLLEWEKLGRKSHWNGNTFTPDMAYHQAHKPVREQTDAVGHSVRAVYLYSAMADLAAETGDETLLSACKILWNSIAQRQLYITGGIGPAHRHEGFTFDYDLPNDSAYQETCASIGLIFFAHRMLKLEPDGRYADVLERALYNSVISGMGQDGRSFFYVNPLEVLPEASVKDPDKRHVKPVRQKWYGCACCPPNIARLLASLGSYIYTSNNDTIYTHLYIGGTAELNVGGGKAVIEQHTAYPWDGGIRIRFRQVPGTTFTLGLRIPGWCRCASLKRNGEAVELFQVLKNGYAHLNGVWKEGDAVELSLDMPAELILANPKVRDNAGKAAIQRGPLVYCLEEADNGKNLSALLIDPDFGLKTEQDGNLPGHPVVVNGRALRSDESSWGNELYRVVSTDSAATRMDSAAPLKHSNAHLVETRFSAIPYYLWANRGEGEMQVWTRIKPV